MLDKSKIFDNYKGSKQSSFKNSLYTLLNVIDIFYCISFYGRHVISYVFSIKNDETYYLVI